MANTKKATSGAATGAIGGAGVGTMIAPGIGTAIGAGAGALIGGLPGLLEDDPADAQQKLEQQRIDDLQSHFDQINAMKGPSLSPQMEARIKSLEAQSVDRPLIEDPYYQGQRAQLVQGGRAALSGVENRQRATGTTGGFSNIGSMNDVYDRLGGQLAQLGGQAQERRDQQAQTAAQLRQNLIDAQTNFENSRHQMLIAARQGSTQQMMAAFQNAQAAQQQANQAQQAFAGSLIGVAGQLGAAQLGAANRAPAISPETSSALANTKVDAQIQNMPSAETYQAPKFGSSYQQPWSAQRSRYGL